MQACIYMSSYAIHSDVELLSLLSESDAAAFTEVCFTQVFCRERAPYATDHLDWTKHLGYLE